MKEQNKEKFYLTTPIYYVNRKPHLGTVYTTIASDIVARFERMLGREVFFLTGTDEHGEKIQRVALENKMTPQEWVDQISSLYKTIWDTLEISHNRFIRTTEEKHKKLVQLLMTTVQKEGFIYEGEYEGLYCSGCERFYTSKELIENRCQYHPHQELSFVKEKSYFFKLSAFQKVLIEKITDGSMQIEPASKRKEVLSWLEQEKLEDLAISRSKVDWAVPLPWDSKQTIYVWMDALINYLSGLGWNGDFQKIPQFWPADCHIIGKDILKFHCVIWPAFLLALGLELPKKIFVHGFLQLNGQKMSKSLGNVIEPEEMIKTFGVDGIRYLLFADLPFGNDIDILLDKIYDQYNADLANGYGNLVSRVFTLALNKKISFTACDNPFFTPQNAAERWNIYREAMQNLKLHEALRLVRKWRSICDQFIDQTKPWEQVKKSPVEYQKTIYNLLESIRHISWMLYPFMPEKTSQVLSALGTWDRESSLSIEKISSWGEQEKYEIKDKINSLFPRI